jgi:hypothetical protein
MDTGYFTYQEAKDYMSEYKSHIKTKRQFVKDMQGWAVGKLPIRPNKIYKDNGWISWEIFLNKTI